MTLSRRGLFIGAGTLLAAPAIVRVASMMPISVMQPTPCYSCGALWGHGPSCSKEWDEFMAVYARIFREAIAPFVHVPMQRGIIYGPRPALVTA